MSNINKVHGITDEQLVSFYFHFITKTFTNQVKFSIVVEEVKNLDLYFDIDTLLQAYQDAKSCPDLW